MDLSFTRNFLVPDSNRAFVGSEKACQKAKYCRLPATRWTMDRDPLLFFDFERKTEDDRAVTIRLRDFLKLDGTHTGLLEARHAIPSAPRGKRASKTASTHRAAISSGEPLAIKVMVRAVSVSRPAAASKSGRATSRRQKTKVTAHAATSTGRARGARIPNTRRNYPTPPTSAASSREGDICENPATTIRTLK